MHFSVSQAATSIIYRLQTLLYNIHSLTHSVPRNACTADCNSYAQRAHTIPSHSLAHSSRPLLSRCAFSTTFTVVHILWCVRPEFGVCAHVSVCVCLYVRACIVCSMQARVRINGGLWTLQLKREARVRIIICVFSSFFLQPFGFSARMKGPVFSNGTISSFEYIITCSLWMWTIVSRIVVCHHRRFKLRADAWSLFFCTLCSVATGGMRDEPIAQNWNRLNCVDEFRLAVSIEFRLIRCGLWQYFTIKLIVQTIHRARVIECPYRAHTNLMSIVWPAPDTRYHILFVVSNRKKIDLSRKYSIRLDAICWNRCRIVSVRDWTTQVCCDRCARAEARTIFRRKPNRSNMRSSF